MENDLLQEFLQTWSAQVRQLHFGYLDMAEGILQQVSLKFFPQEHS